MTNPYLYLFLLLFVQNSFGQVNGRFTVKLRDTTIDERPFVKGVFEGFEFLIHKREFIVWGDNDMFNFKVIKQGQLSELDSLNNRLSYKLSDTIRCETKQMFVEKIDEKMRFFVVQVLPKTEGPKFGYRIGEIIEDMNFMTVQNKVFNNRGKKGEFILYDFWGTWCFPCIKNMPKLKAFSQTEKAKTFKIVSVSVELDFSKSLDSNVMRVKRKMEELKMDWDNVYEQSLKITKKNKSDRKVEKNYNMLKEKLNIQNFPTYIITDYKGLILHRSTDFEIVQKFIDSISLDSD
jgi:thiol-disulfide isomerase/thioredoxin